MRLFVGLPMPPEIARALYLMQGGIPGARWEAEDKLHLTLRYIGEVDGGTKRRIETALSLVDGAPWSMALRGVGHFPPRGNPRSVWAGVADPTPLQALHEEIDDTLTALGLDADPRNFAPHVTLARLRNAPSRDVADFLARHALLASPAFVVDHFCLFSSVRTAKGSKYRIEHVYRLQS